MTTGTGSLGHILKLATKHAISSLSEAFLDKKKKKLRI